MEDRNQDVENSVFSKAVSVSFVHVIGIGIVTFSAILWPFQHFCDLFMTLLWPFQQFYDLFVTFVTFLGPFQHFCDLFVNDKKGYHFMNDKMILSRFNCDLFCEQHYLDLNCDLFVNDTI